MATATAAATRREVKEYTFSWEGRDRGGKVVRGDMRASGEAVVQSTLRRQGVTPLKIKRQRAGMGGKVGDSHGLHHARIRHHVIEDAQQEQ